MNVSVQIKSGRDWVKRGMFATMGKFGDVSKPLSDESFTALIVGRHSPIEEYEIWVDAVVPERVHTHVVRHKELGKYVATSRPDIAYGVEDGVKMRPLSLRINAKRLLEVMELRLCACSWNETIELFKEIKRQVVALDSTLGNKLMPSCVWKGFCPERKDCGYTRSPRFAIERDKLISWNTKREDK